MDNSDSDDYELTPSRELDDLRHEVSSLKRNSMVEGDKARMLIESMDRLTISINRFVTILNDAQKDIIDEYQESKPTEKLNQLLEQSETIAKVLISMNENMGGNASSSSGSRNPLPTTSDYSSQPSLQQALNPSSQAYSSNAPVYQPSAQNYSSPQASQQNYSPPIAPNYPPAYSQSPSFNNMPPMSQQNSGLMNDPRNPLPIPVPSYMNSSNITPSNMNQMNQQSMNQQPMSFNPSMNSMNSPSMSLGDDFPPMDDIPPLESPKPSVPKKKFLGIM